jgi:ribosomal-protein-alanine N-acetyltransferase
MIANNEYPIRRLGENDVDALESLFLEFISEGVDRYFHPHPLDRQTAERICCSAGRDYYCCGWDGTTAISYGLLRGLDEGFVVPALGIATRRGRRRQGLARAMMKHLHSIARQYGVKRIRLKVYPGNQAAIPLYLSFGYVFDPESDEGQLVGYCEL